MRLRTALVPTAGALLLSGCGLLSGGAPSPAVSTAPPGDCPSEAAVAQQIAQYLAMQPIPNPPAGLSAEGAACNAQRWVAQLQATQGRVVGYKAGLTTPAMQQRFGMAAPLRGVLLERMLLQGGAQVPAQFGAHPFAESDLVVEVASSAINSATTGEQALAALKNVYPFIELPDRLYEDPSKLNAAALTAGNVGARLGVLGAPIAVQNTPAFAQALSSMTVRLTDATGKEHAVGKGADILGDPLNAVLWLVADVKKSGGALKAGDLLSLGGFGVAPVAAGQTLTARYDGLPGNPSVSVTFTAGR